MIRQNNTKLLQELITLGKNCPSALKLEESRKPREYTKAVS